MPKNDIEAKKWLFGIGIILLVFSSLIIGFLNISVFYLLGIPFLPFLIGLFLIWSSGVSLRYKLVCMILPLPNIFLGFLIFYQILPKAEPETFLIADNYRGRREILYDEECGDMIEYENGRRIYEIPESGILIVRGPQTLGIMDRKFMLVDALGNQRIIPEFHWSDYDRERQDWHWYFSPNKMNRETVGVFWAYRFGISFMVSNFDDFEIDKKQKENRTSEFENLRNEVLQNCRNHTN